MPRSRPIIGAFSRQYGEYPPAPCWHGLQGSFQTKQNAHHVLHLGFIAAAAADDGLFDFGCRVFVHFDAPARYGADRRPPRLPQLQRRIGISRHEYTLDPALGRLVRGDDVTEFVEDAFEPQRKACLASHGQRRMKDM
jgi:hypothetical protein